MVLLKTCQSVPCLRLSHSLETFITLEKIFYIFQSKLKLQDKIHFGPLKEAFQKRTIVLRHLGEFKVLQMANFLLSLYPTLFNTRT